MNRKLIGVLLTIALLVLAVAPAFAEQEQVDIYEDQELVKSVAFIIGVNEYFVNDQTPGVKMDVAPYIASGRTFVPVRFLGNALGIPNYDITWDGDKSQAALKRGDILLTMVIGKKETVTNGVKRAIDVAPVIKNARTFLPARFVAEGLGYNVDWDAEHNIVICWPKGEAKPDISNVIEKAKTFKDKPAAVQKLESALGITMEETKYEPGCWVYNLPEPYIPVEPARSEIIKNKDKSYIYASVETDGHIWINIRWASVVPDINTVTYDLSPIEKTLKAFFPGHESEFPTIMAKAKQIAEKTKESNRFERLDPAVFYLNGHEVGLSSFDFNFVTLDIVGA